MPLLRVVCFQALASVGEWEALRKFGAERKSPIGYKPFAVACMRQSKTGLLGDDTERYIDSYIERVSVLVAHTPHIHSFVVEQKSRTHVVRRMKRLSFETCGIYSTINSAVAL